MKVSQRGQMSPNSLSQELERGSLGRPDILGLYVLSPHPICLLMALSGVHQRLYDDLIDIYVH